MGATFHHQIARYMHPLFKKLNYKDQPAILVLGHPDSFKPILDEMRPHASIITEMGQDKSIQFAIAFVKTQQEVNATVTSIAPLLEGDAILWMCYPKGTSKRYTCDFNRDTGWDIFGEYGMEGVRQVAIDEDWSALRFRKVAFIKTMTRKFKALSQEGKSKTGQGD